MEIKITLLNQNSNTVKEFKGEKAIIEARDYFIGLAPFTGLIGAVGSIGDNETIAESEEAKESTIEEIDLTNRNLEARPSWFKKKL